ncbi:MAG: SHOCT domain-containing protein [Gammaproteobacteria bacterium]|nr:SHOCT domain-containing protein [Gammaproteobacteria bacterium]
MLVYSIKRFTRFVSIVAVVLLLHGCSNTVAMPKHGEIAVDSEPSGATVYVMGKVQGNTPLLVQLQDVFPIVYAPDQQDLYGLVILKKDGCQDYLQRVSSAVLNTGVKAELDCADVAAEQTPTQTPQADQSGIPVPAPTSLKQRLIRLDELHRDGLITDEEYAAARRRILDEL